MQGGKKIIYNTIILYIRMFVSIAIGLYSTRIILNALGVSDYGIYNLVAGVIVMLSFLKSAMAASTQRYLSHTLGSKNTEKLKQVFTTSISTHILLGIIIVLLLEFAGLPFLKRSLTIPHDRITAALYIFQFMVLSAFFSVLTVPYDGLLNAHENFLIIALTEIFLSVGSLLTAIYLNHTGYDRLIVFGIATTVFLIIQFFYKLFYCQFKYTECNYKFKKYADKQLFSEMISFAGWNMFGALCSMARNQGIAIVLNMFFGVIINAAYGIANLVNGQLVSLSSVIGKAISPQLTKSEGEGDRARMLNLGMLASKIPFMLMALASVPLILEMPYILDLWLKNPPANAVMFTRLILVLTLVSTLSYGIITVLLAIGKIKTYQIVVGSTLLLNIPISWIIFKWGAPAYSAIIVAVILEIISHFLRLIFLQSIAGRSMKTYILNVDFKPLLVMVASFILTYCATYYLNSNFLRLIFSTMLTTSIMCFGWYRYALSESEKKSIYAMSSLVIHKISSKLKISSI